MDSSSSLVSKAKTAFHSAAAKAEKVLTEIKADLKTDHRVPEEADVSSQKQQSKLDSECKKIEQECSHEVKHTKWKPPHLGKKQDWQNRLKNIRRRKPDAEEREKHFNLSVDVSGHNEDSDQVELGNSPEVKGLEKESPTQEGESNALNMGIIPPSSAVKQLAIAVESAKKFKSMSDLLASSRDSSPVRERASLSFSAMKSLVLREKEEKSTEFGYDDEVLSLSQMLFSAERDFSKEENGSGSAASLPRDIHGAPPECFVVELSEIIGSFKTLRKMVLFWCRVLEELRRLWSDRQPVPHVPLDDNPDLSSCLLHQQLQVINCCISRKKRRAIASESLNSVMTDAEQNSEESVSSPSVVSSSSALYARVSTGDLVLRLGADHPFDNLTMLETGEPVYCPVTQEGPILTEDLIRENEEFVLRTGSVGAGCSQLLSDMQAFKAANPGCILEDFVRWHSPPDWKDSDPAEETADFYLADPTSKRGQLSTRMQKEEGIQPDPEKVRAIVDWPVPTSTQRGTRFSTPCYSGLASSYFYYRGNLWRELWETAKPVPAVNQIPLFDEDLAVEGILDFLEEISPLELFQQLFVSLLGKGFVIAEDMLSTSSELCKLFHECKDYVLATCQGKTWSDNIDDLCQVYETVETIVLNPEDCLKTINQCEETTTVGEPKRRFMKLSLNFKDRNFLRKPSIFSKKPPKSNSMLQSDSPSCPDENDWTIV